MHMQSAAAAAAATRILFRSNGAFAAAEGEEDYQAIRGPGSRQDLDIGHIRQQGR